MLGPDTIDSTMTISTIPNSSWHWICNSDLSNREPAFTTTTELIPNRGLIPLVNSNATNSPVTIALPPETNETIIGPSGNLTLITTPSFQSSIPSPNLITTSVCTNVNTTITITSSTCDTSISDDGKSASSLCHEPASYLLSSLGSDLDHLQLRVHDIPTTHLFQNTITSTSSTVLSTPAPKDSAVRLVSSPLTCEPTDLLPQLETDLSRSHQLRSADQSSNLSIVDELNETFLACFNRPGSPSPSPSSSSPPPPPPVSLVHHSENPSTSIESIIDQFAVPCLAPYEPNSVSFVCEDVRPFDSTQSTYEHPSECLPIPNHHHHHLPPPPPHHHHTQQLFAVRPDQIHVHDIENQNQNLLAGSTGTIRPNQLIESDEQIFSPTNQSPYLHLDPQHRHPGHCHEDQQPQTPIQHHHQQQQQQHHHQWDIKDAKLPKVEHFDPYEQWPTGHCRRVYTQSCERARRHQSGWAMRNTNNHNPQVLKKSCLGVLECSAGCLIQGKPLSLRPAICDKARKKQCNRSCITPGCPGRLVLRSCRGHSGYPVTHFWRFANGAVYFEAKGEHDHNRPSLKTFGLSEPDSIADQTKPYMTDTNGTLTITSGPTKPSQTMANESGTEDRLEIGQNYTSLSSLWNLSETQQQQYVGRSRCGTHTGRGRSNIKSGVKRMNRREKKMAGVRQKTLKSHQYKLNSLLQTPLEHLAGATEVIKHQNCGSVLKISNQLHTPLTCNPQMIVQPAEPSLCPTYPNHKFSDPNQPCLVAMTTPVWYESQSQPPPPPPQHQHSASLNSIPNWLESQPISHRSSIDLNSSPHLNAGGSHFESNWIGPDQSQVQILPTFWQLATGNDLQTETSQHSVLSELDNRNTKYNLNPAGIEPNNSPMSSVFSSPDWSPSTSSLSGCSSKTSSKSTIVIAGSIAHSTEQLPSTANLHHLPNHHLHHHHNHQLEQQQQQQQQQQHSLLHPSLSIQQSDGINYGITNPNDTHDFVLNSLSTTGSTGLLSDSSLSASEWITSTHTDQWFDLGPPNDAASMTTTTTTTTTNLNSDQTNTTTDTMAMTNIVFSTPSIELTKQLGISDGSTDQQSWSYQDSDLPIKVDLAQTTNPYYAFSLDDTVQWFSVGQQPVLFQQQQQQRHQQPEQHPGSEWSQDEPFSNRLQTHPLEMSSESVCAANDRNLIPAYQLISHQPFPMENYKSWDMESQPNPTGSCSDSLKVIPAGINQSMHVIQMDYDLRDKIPTLTNNSSSYFVTDPNRFENWSDLGDPITVATTTATCISISSSSSSDSSIGSHAQLAYSHDCLANITDSRTTQFQLPNWNGATTDYAFCRQCD